METVCRWLVIAGLALVVVVTYPFVVLEAILRWLWRVLVWLVDVK